MALQLFVQPRAGELIAQGIDGLAQGIEKYYQRKEDNAKMEQAADFFLRAADANPEMARMFGIRDTNDKAAAKAGIKAMGGPMQFMQAANAMQQMMERQQAAEQERKQRFALQDAADPIMQMANRQLTPEQFTSGQALGSNDFLRNAIAMGADPRMAAPVANVMQDTEIAGMRNELAAAKANKPAHTPKVVQVGGVDYVETSPGNYTPKPKDKPEEKYAKGERRMLNINGKQVEGEYDGRRWVDPQSQQPLYLEVNDIGDPIEPTPNPMFAPKPEAPPARTRLKLVGGRLVPAS